MGKKEEKTNVMRVLEGKKVPYESHAYTPDARPQIFAKTYSGYL